MDDKLSQPQNTLEPSIEILAVEDSPTQAARLSFVLEGQGYTVLSATDGVDALALLETCQPALVISDIVMPQMNGFQLCTQIREDPRLRDIPVILLTSLANPEDVLQGLNCGADDFITKPYNDAYLLEHIEQVLANVNLRKPHQERVDLDVVFGGKRHTLSVDQRQMLTLLLSTYEAAVQRNDELVQAQAELRMLNENLEDLVDERTAALSAEIAERKEAQAALTESEMRHRAVIFSANDAVVSIDPSGHISGWNRAAERMFGYVEEQILGKPASTLIPDQRAGSHFRGLDRMLLGDSRRTVNSKIVVEGHHRTGRTFPVELSLSEWEMKGERHFTAFIRDVTEMRQLEKERAQFLNRVWEQAQRVQQIMGTIPLGIILLNAYNKVLLANPLAEMRLSALSNCQVGEVLIDLGEFSLSALQAPHALGQKHEIRHDTHVYEITVHAIEHTAQQGSDVANVFDVALPETGSWVLVIDDITDAREARNYREAQDRLATVGQLAAGIAHDFNNIMGTIVLYSGLMARSADLTEAQHRSLGVIEEQARHASRLTRQILDFSRRAPMERTPVNLHNLITEMVKLFERTLPEDIELVVRVEENEPWDEQTVDADPTRLQQALMNLALNARDAMSDGGRLTFALDKLTVEPTDELPAPDMTPGTWVRVSIQDTGTGIAPDIMTHLFEPFFTTKGPGSGTGLGLAQVYGIVKQHDGVIDVSTQQGEGTTFHVYLPVSGADAADSAPISPDADGVVFSSNPQERILLVEDNSATRGAAVAVLEELGYQVMSANNGMEALTQIKSQEIQIDLVLTDLIMPEMGGLELHRHIREFDPEIKVMIMTGHALDGGGYDALIDQDAPWILKPFSIEDIAVKIRRVFDIK